MGRSRSTTTQVQEMPQFQQDYLQNVVIPFATNISEQPFTPYTGQMTAQFSPLAMGAMKYYDRVGEISAMTPADYAAMTAENYNPYQERVVDATLARAAREREQQRTLQQAEVAQRRAFGNERRGVYEAELQTGYDLGIAEQIANLMRQGYSEAQAATMAQLGQRQQAALAAAQGQTQLGTLQQATEQAGLEAAYNQYLMEQNYPLTQLGALTGAAGVIPGGYGTTTGGASSRPGFSGILGGVASLGQGLGAMGWKPFG